MLHARRGRVGLVETEAGFQGWIVELARLSGWRVYHTLRSKGSEAGWPDLVLIRPPRLIVAEVKTARGRLSPAQKTWLDDLAACGVDVHVWKPDDRPAIEALLERDIP